MKSPSLEQLRLGVFISWLAFAAVLSLLPFALLFSLHDRREVDAHVAGNLALSLSSLWLPALGCFAGYWFGSNETTPRTRRKRNAKLVALVLTSSALLGILFAVSITLFTHDFSAQNDPGSTFLGNAVR